MEKTCEGVADAETSLVLLLLLLFAVLSVGISEEIIKSPIKVPTAIFVRIQIAAEIGS